MVFFGGEPLGVPVLEILKKHGLLPKLIVCSPDRPSGRKLVLTPPPVKIWAEEHNIPTFQPESLKDKDALTPLTKTPWDLFVVVAYNHILPKWLIELPKYKTINLHPSLLPKLRGPSPIRTAILQNEPGSTGVSVMLLDEKMDHGPLLAQEAANLQSEDWPTPGPILDTLLAKQGGELLARVIPEWQAGHITPIDQVHENATYTHKMTKAMGELEIDPHHLPTGQQAREALLKIRALAGWPGTYFFYNGARIKVIDALIDKNDVLVLQRVIPEGKREQSFAEYLKTIT